MRTVITNEPFTDVGKYWTQRGYWPAKWIGHPDQRADEPGVVAYRLCFSLDEALKVRVHTTADERYELLFDGVRIGRGSERGDRENWFYETYDLDLSAGDHVLVARTWWIGSEKRAPYAQISVRPGFLLAAEGVPDDLLNTGVARWESRALGGYSFIPETLTWGTGPKLHVRGDEVDWGWQTGLIDGWSAAVEVGPACNASVANEYPPMWMLRPATLPAMLEETRKVGEARHVERIASEDTQSLPVVKAKSISAEEEKWNRMLRGDSPLVLPAETMCRAIIDIGNYYCAYPELVCSGGRGSSVIVRWAEALYEKPEVGPKGNRDEIESKYFIGIGDIFEPDGGEGRVFDTLWWEAGRYLEVVVSTKDEALTIESLGVRETHYPYDYEFEFDSSDPRPAEVIPIAIRGLEMCSHETYMDCPYYEQLQYVGDTRLEVLTTYALTRDERLPRKAILMFDASRKNSGITQSRYPSRVMQIIPPFSLWWIGMVYDYAMWRDDLAFVSDRMPGVRAVLDAFRRWINGDGLVESPNGWNYMDWVPEWFNGMPPDGNLGVSAVINCQLALVLGFAAELEDMMGEPELAERNRKLARMLREVMFDKFWDESRGMLADDLSREYFSEHTQCLAILGATEWSSRYDLIARGLMDDPDISRTTIYFSHYLFETCRRIGRMDRFFERMELWYDLKRLGFKTTFEEPEPSRSDCHAWGAHPLHHYFASVLGIRPASPGFAGVRIEPQLGHLTSARGTLPHPLGYIRVDFEVRNGGLAGTVELPDGVSGTISYGGRTRELHPGSQEIGM